MGKSFGIVHRAETGQGKMKNVTFLTTCMVVIATVESYILRYPGLRFFPPLMRPVFHQTVVPTVHRTFAAPSVTQTVAVPGLTQTVSVPGVAQTVAVPTVSQTVAVPGVAHTVAVPGVAQTVAVPGVAQTVAVTNVAQTMAVPGDPSFMNYNVHDNNYRDSNYNDIANSNSYNPLTGEAEAFNFAVSSDPTAFGSMW